MVCFKRPRENNLLDASKSDKTLSRVVEWLHNVSKACVKSFLNKQVDITITDRGETTKKGSLKIESQKGSALMLGMATKAKGPTFSGTS